MTHSPMPPAPRLSYVGAHFSKCPVEIRELWTRSFDSEHGRIQLATIARRHFGAVGVVPIFTCNRFDICMDVLPSEDELLCFFVDLTREAAATLSVYSQGVRSMSGPETETFEVGRGSERLREDLQELTNHPEQLRRLLRLASGTPALLQLFRVAASLDSLVLGEPHVLGQLKEQLAVARDLGLCSSGIESVFARSFNVAKRVRSETDLGRNAVSIGHAAVALAGRVFEDLSRQRALVIGAGEMARLSSQHLCAHGARQVVIANRTFQRAQDLAECYPGRAQALSLSSALADLTQFDVVIVATASRQLLIRPEHFADFKRERRGSPMVIVDVSVPRNVDPSCAAVSSHLYVFDVDDLDKVMEHNRELRKEAAESAERIIHGDVEAFLRSQQQRDNLRNVGGFHRLVREIVSRELQKTLGREGSIARPEQVTVIADAVAKSLVTCPAAKVRAGASLSAQSIGQALEELFDLEARVMTNPTLGEDVEAEGSPESLSPTLRPSHS